LGNVKLHVENVHISILIVYLNLKAIHRCLKYCVHRCFKCTILYTNNWQLLFQVVEILVLSTYKTGQSTPNIQDKSKLVPFYCLPHLKVS